MENYIEFTGEQLSADLLSATAARIAGEENCEGSFTCFMKDGAVVCVPPEESLIAGRVLRRAALELGALPRSENHFFNDADHDVGFSDWMPSPEDEVGSLFLKFRIIGAPDDKSNLIINYCRNEGFDYSAESDGFSIFLNPLAVLNLYFEPVDDSGTVGIVGELDCSMLGAGIYADALEIAEEICESVGGEITFASDELLSYPVDRDFEKLRQLFYTSMRQQLAFAEADDLDGAQAYIGWSVDTYEPLEVRGSIITPFGRLSIDELKHEITVYGFDAVIDYRLLLRNCPAMNIPAEKMKVAIAFLWSDVSGERIFARGAVSPSAFVNEDNVYKLMNEAVAGDKSIPAPLPSYMELITTGKFPPMDFAPALTHPKYRPHYKIGYLHDEIKYGFGSYLRCFRLPGGFCPFERIPGRFIEFEGMGLIYEKDSHYVQKRSHIRVVIDYGPDASISNDFFRPEFDWSDRDIGGSAVCRVGVLRNPDPMLEDTTCILAAIQIRDEVYYFSCEANEPEYIDGFLKAVSECRAIEDVDDLIPFDHTDKPRAWGATYFVSGEASKPPFEQAFEQIAPLLAEYRIPMTTLCTVYQPTTDISSKFGGTPYCPPGSKMPSFKGKPFDFIAQLNFAELNPDGACRDFPTKGLLEIWVRDLNELFRYPSRYLPERHPDFRMRWYPEPVGGYITEPRGAALIAKRDTMLPTIVSPGYTEITELFDTTMNSLTFDYADEVDEILTCRKNHIDGAPELVNAQFLTFDQDGASSIDSDRLLLQLEVPKAGGRMLFMIPPDALKSRDFERTKLIAYTENRTDRKLNIKKVLSSVRAGNILYDRLCEIAREENKVISLTSALEVASANFERVAEALTGYRDYLDTLLDPKNDLLSEPDPADYDFGDDDYGTMPDAPEKKKPFDRSKPFGIDPAEFDKLVPDDFDPNRPETFDPSKVDFNELFRLFGLGGIGGGDGGDDDDGDDFDDEPDGQNGD